MNKLNTIRITLRNIPLNMPFDCVTKADKTKQKKSVTTFLVQSFAFQNANNHGSLYMATNSFALNIILVNLS